MDFLRKVEAGIKEAHSNITDLVSGPEEEKHSHTHPGHECVDIHPDHHRNNRYGSFAPQTTGNVKWYVDGCSYFWAVSEAIESARESIYILDWWLSPELYLRRPPAANEKYRLDNLLKAAAERGVSVKVIVYKEVQAALTLNSAHTRQRLESLHNNISVFRHPDHTPTGYNLAKDLSESFKNFSLSAASVSKASVDTLKAIYGTSDGMVLFWAHHEKLCVIDERVAFMGGLDMCFGRWDTTSHPLADAHPGNLDATVFPGQDYGNARIYDFDKIEEWEKNKLDRTRSSRMGWTDVSISLNGPITGSLIHHFKDRWNYLFKEKYSKKNPGRYAKFDRILPPGGESGHHSWRDPNALLDSVHGRMSRGLSQWTGHENRRERSRSREGGASTSIQLVRSSTKWSSGLPTEHSIADAYIDAITKAEHFVYIENQFFITATSDKQRPVSNKIGAAIVDRILRAHRAAEDFLIIIVIPAVPGFPGDLKSDGALGTRAIMEFQYFSINRGGHSILEKLREGGVTDPSRYISFYNLRNYDRINTSSTMAEAERASGVSYERARKEYDNAVGAGDRLGEPVTRGGDQYQRYQQAAARVEDRTWDTISSSYMSGGPDLASIPWHGAPEAEMDAFVSEELYVHSKLLIADDRLVICGSANINDRSQLGSHDSEIAVVIEEQGTVDSRMNGRPRAVGKFAASLRRYISRKHLGLLPDQRCDRPEGRNWSSVEAGPNEYDWGSEADALVRDPLDPAFRRLWAGTARVNTEVFSRAFHVVPNDKVRTWEDYDSFFSKHFSIPGVEEKKDGAAAAAGKKTEYGHVVASEFPGGVRELKEWLGRVRGTLVEMPLGFLADVDDIAKEGVGLNGLTMELYT
ncbi:related to phospholipase D [Cephalotrichum gorgonifer]|uniref:Phospholipase n=1 Tax=Cephalotrichum gorgonifer TaxID=2041049 RepID=A0AAE8MU01_9PEZI|nr:related to phospholipase D [Cephalotrichum gorgonifer]